MIVVIENATFGETLPSDQGHVFVNINGEIVLLDPVELPNGTVYIAQVNGKSRKDLNDMFGAQNIRPLVVYVRTSQEFADWAKINLSVIRNSIDEPVGVRPRVVLAGHSDIDLDGQTIETALPIMSLL